MEFRYLSIKDKDDGVVKHFFCLYLNKYRDNNDNKLQVKDIVKFLDLSLEEFKGILLKNNGKIYGKQDDADESNYSCYFLNFGDLNSFVEDMNPYLMMSKLVE